VPAEEWSARWLSAALGASSLSWRLVQPSIATRARAYDRVGFGWSEGGLMRTAGRIADELHQLLEIAAVPGRRAARMHVAQALREE